MGTGDVAELIRPGVWHGDISFLAEGLFEAIRGEAELHKKRPPLDGAASEIDRESRQGLRRTHGGSGYLDQALAWI
ncbi:predicted protein [Coccidioides posadasii str. Silveira]|uniref:Predicted protein n=1 Tax=Coccidioides posadasii (strain RMSCC 757 / Silveira) TaxID=443226 RepID=E9D1I5_COCPS|nr:predicted protein [Coccidioides posadasii str. Silveira]